MLMYERVFQILKNKIESGLLPEGTSLPSRADLCQEYGTSEKQSAGHWPCWRKIDLFKPHRESVRW